MVKKPNLIKIGVVAIGVTILIISSFAIFFVRIALAADCGGSTPCSCGDTLIESRTLNGSDNFTNCPGNGLAIGADGITLDCDNRTIDGTGDNLGIYLIGKSGNTIKNCVVTDFNYGIPLGSSSNNNITDNTVNSNNEFGIFLTSSNNNQITNNVANDHTGGTNPSGIYLIESSNNTLVNNIAKSNTKGIYLDSSSSNNITGNTVNSNNEFGIHLISNSNNNTIINNTVNNNLYGIVLESSSNNTLTHNTANNNAGSPYSSGITVVLSGSNTITNNAAKFNDVYGICIFDSSSTGSTFTSNDLCTNNHADYDINDADANTFSDSYCNSGRKYTDGTTQDCANSCSSCIDFDGDDYGNLDTDLSNCSSITDFDTLQGLDSHVSYSEGISSVDVQVNGGAESGTFSGTKTVTFHNVSDGSVYTEFDHNFDTDVLYIMSSELSCQTGNGFGWTLLEGLTLPTGKKKTLYIDTKAGTNRVCVDNTPISDISDISSDCSQAGETLFNACTSSGQTIDGITCKLEGGRYKVTGLDYSGGQEMAGEEGEAVPEFTTITFIIAAVAGFGIYLLVRRKNSRKTQKA